MMPTISDSIYSVTGLDARTFLPITALPDTVLAAHLAIRYLPSGHEIPFFDLGSIGGGESDIGGEQLLRGFGQGRFVDRDSSDATIELRHRAFGFDAAASHVDIEVAPFLDMGRVFSRTGADPFSDLHKVVGGWHARHRAALGGGIRGHGVRNRRGGRLHGDQLPVLRPSRSAGNLRKLVP